jgi:hypothetical protein
MAMQWHPLTNELPKGEVLVWLGDRAAVAVLVPADENYDAPSFMDARTSDLLPWPTHFMPLTPPL